MNDKKNEKENRLHEENSERDNIVPWMIKVWDSFLRV